VSRTCSMQESGKIEFETQSNNDFIEMWDPTDYSDLRPTKKITNFFPNIEIYESRIDNTY
jgi:hypothetical protein